MQLFLLSKSNLKNQRIIKKPHYIFDNFRQNDYDGLVWLVHIIPAFLGARPSEHSGSHSDVCLKLLSTSPGPAPGTKPYPELKIGLVTSTSSHWAPEYWSYALLLLTLNRSIEEREHFLLLDVWFETWHLFWCLKWRRRTVKWGHFALAWHMRHDELSSQWPAAGCSYRVTRVS